MTAEVSPELIARLRADSSYAVETFEEFWRLHNLRDPDSKRRRDHLLGALKAAGPDLSIVITGDKEGEGWNRSQLARMLMDPTQAKAASVQRLVGKLSDALLRAKSS